MRGEGNCGAASVDTRTSRLKRFLYSGSGAIRSLYYSTSERTEKKREEEHDHAFTVLLSFELPRVLKSHNSPSLNLLLLDDHL